MLRMSHFLSWLRTTRDLARGVVELPRLSQTRLQVEYLGLEVARLNAAMRSAAWHAKRRSALATQARASFDFQWEHIPPSHRQYLSRDGECVPEGPTRRAALLDDLRRA